MSLDDVTVQINYRDMPKSDALDSHIRGQIETDLARIADKLTRIEIHLGDESSVKKHTPGDKRCMMEARPRGLDPISVEAHADDIFAAVSEASGKLGRALTRRFEKKGGS